MPVAKRPMPRSSAKIRMRPHASMPATPPASPARWRWCARPASPSPTGSSEREGGIAGGGQHPCRRRAAAQSEELAERAALRLDVMLAGGAMEEVAALVAREAPADRPSAARARCVGRSRRCWPAKSISQKRGPASSSRRVAYQKRQPDLGARAAGRTGRSLDPEEEIDLNNLAAVRRSPARRHDPIAIPALRRHNSCPNFY